MQKTVELLAKDLNGHGGVFCPSPLADMKLWNSHPKVFLDVARTGHAKCPYCSTEYRLKAGEHLEIASAHGARGELRQLGIGDDVEIGSHTTIDRGAIEDTIIEQGAKIDNQVQIAHNVVIGAYTVVAGTAAFAGSAKIGRYPPNLQF
jgi:uncharacterized Zn-finger protein